MNMKHEFLLSQQSLDLYKHLYKYELSPKLAPKLTYMLLPDDIMPQ